MCAGQWVLCLLQDPFKQTKLSLTLTLTRVTARAVVAIIIETLKACMLAETLPDV